MTFPQTARTTALRDKGRIEYERAAAHAILDEAHHCHLAFTVDGGPRILPTLHVRIGDTVYVHGSTGSRPLLAARGDGLDVCLAVTHLDGLVLARSQFHHSANYRSAVVHGRAFLVADPERKAEVLAALVDKIAPGRSAQTRPPNRRELAETAVLAIQLTEASVKARLGGVNEEPEDYALPYWAGVVPLRLTPGRPEPDSHVSIPLPDNLRQPVSPWLTPETLRGDHVILEPLDMSHVDGLSAAVADPEVFAHLTVPCPTDRDGMATIVAQALHAADLGQRVPWVQRDAGTGEILGTTSYYAVDEAQRAVAIGHTFIGRRWWRTAVNTESKLLLLTRAFETLGAERVEWHTDIRNERSQRAIERLGALQEGVLRRHRQRVDGSWRDTVLYSMTAPEWPTCREKLRSKLSAGSG